MSHLDSRPRGVVEVNVAELDVSNRRFRSSRFFALRAEDVNLGPPPNQRLQFSCGALGDGEGLEVGEGLSDCRCRQAFAIF